MTRAVVLLSCVLPALGCMLPALGCSSWNTGSGSGDQAEQACLDTVETYARAAERCGSDYKTSYDKFLRADASGDCKNVSSIRDETALRTTCLPFVKAQLCEDLANGLTDPSCSAQLEK